MKYIEDFETVDSILRNYDYNVSEMYSFDLDTFIYHNKFNVYTMRVLRLNSFLLIENGDDIVDLLFSKHYKLITVEDKLKYVLPDDLIICNKETGEEYNGGIKCEKYLKYIEHLDINVQIDFIRKMYSGLTFELRNEYV